MLHRFDPLRRTRPHRVFESVQFDGRDGLLILAGGAAYVSLFPLLPRGLGEVATTLLSILSVLPFALPFVRRWWFGPLPPRVLRVDRLGRWFSLGSLALLAAGLAGVVVASFAAFRLCVEPRSPFDLFASWHHEHREVGLRWLLGSLGAALLLAMIAFKGLEARFEAAPLLRGKR